LLGQPVKLQPLSIGLGPVTNRRRMRSADAIPAQMTDNKRLSRVVKKFQWHCAESARQMRVRSEAGHFRQRAASPEALIPENTAWRDQKSA
jgi:hypothetical protein